MLDVAAIIDGARVRALHVQVFALCALCMMIDGFDVQALGYAAPALVEDWGIEPGVLGPVFGAGNFGVLIGQLTFTILADRVGRRPVLIGGVSFFAILTLATGFVTSVQALLALRFVAGLGMGSVIPNVTALISEYSPRRSRVTMMTWVGTGFNVGAAAGGFLAAWLIPRYGWEAVFFFGGGAPLLLVACMVVWLPESLKLLALKRRPSDNAYIARWLRRVDPSVTVPDTATFAVTEEQRKGVPVAQLFRDGRARFTLLLWVMNFMNLLALYSLSNWLPTVVRGAGYDTSTAVLVGTTLQVGGTLSPFLLAWLIVRRGFIPVLAVTFGIATVAVALIGTPGLSLALLVGVVFIAGACVPGSQASINALSGTFYPTYLRSTGVGWGLGVGRVGAIVGPMLTGLFITMQWSTQRIFLSLAIPAFITMLATISMAWTTQVDEERGAARP
ncbi:MAG: aromatic acid/H+ symport family MFS transporter [Acidimicrobiia bacterium]|nr:aromatic acid/H+ symport family MFS transporter [Acidimicrobiia bacterium]